MFSRIIYFPFVVLHTTLVKSMWLYEPFFGYYFFNSLLAVLQLLHLYWFYLILEMAYNLLKGKEISDTRSEDEYSVDESDNDNLPDAKKTK
jgi:very-long-chain ceramide synthase